MRAFPVRAVQPDRGRETCTLIVKSCFRCVLEKQRLAMFMRRLHLSRSLPEELTGATHK